MSFHSRSTNVSACIDRLFWSITFLQRLVALERDQELVWRVKGGGVVLDLNAEQRDDRHDEECGARKSMAGWMSTLSRCVG